MLKLAGVVTIAAIMPLTTCGGGGSDPIITTKLTDAPGDFVSVPIVVARVEAHRGDAGEEAGWRVLVSEPQAHDLLTLRDGVTAVLGEHSLPAGTYDQLRLVLQSAEVEVEGEQPASTTVHVLDVPSGAQTGLKIHTDLTVEEDTEYELVLDFDAAASIRQIGNGTYKLTPVLRVKHFGRAGADDGDG